MNRYLPSLSKMPLDIFYYLPLFHFFEIYSNCWLDFRITMQGSWGAALTVWTHKLWYSMTFRGLCAGLSPSAFFWTWTPGEAVLPCWGRRIHSLWDRPEPKAPKKSPPGWSHLLQPLGLQRPGSQDSPGRYWCCILLVIALKMTPKGHELNWEGLGSQWDSDTAKGPYTRLWGSSSFLTENLIWPSWLGRLEDK